MYVNSENPCTTSNKRRKNGFTNSLVNSSASNSLVQRLIPPCSFSILIYMDDILILGPSSTRIGALIKSLSEHFTLRDLGTASHFLGVPFWPCNDGYFLTEGHYIASILKCLNMAHCKPLATPSPVVTPTSKSALYDDPTLYRSVVGALQYLNMTNPDIAFAINQACCSMHSPHSTDWVQLKHLLQY